MSHGSHATEAVTLIMVKKSLIFQSPYLDTIHFKFITKLSSLVNKIGLTWMPTLYVILRAACYGEVDKNYGMLLLGLLHIRQDYTKAFKPST